MVGVAAVYATSPRLRPARWLLPFLALSATGLLVLLNCPPGRPCVLLVELLFLSPYVVLDSGVRDLFGKARRVPLPGLVLLAIQALGYLVLSLDHRPPASSALLFSILAAIQLALTCITLLQSAMRGTRVATWSLASVLAVTALAHLFRARLALTAWTAPSTLPPASLRLSGLVLLMVSTVAILFSFLWITTEQLRLELDRMARTDPLTGVLNRRAFEAEFGREIARAHRSRAPLAILLLDLDHFKNINDAYGHAIGDTVLSEVAHLLQRALRRADLVARLGGEEFAALLPDTDRRQAAVTAERLRAAVELMRVPAGIDGLRITASFGVTAWQGDADTWDQLLRRVDIAMYQAKEAGRDCIRVA
jgi:diguanylate cyclase (GGDEF)-like protein